MTKLWFNDNGELHVWVSEWMSGCLYLSGWFTLTRKQQQQQRHNKTISKCCSRINADNNNTHAEMNERKKEENWRTNAPKEFVKLNQLENDIVTQSVLGPDGPSNGNENEIKALFAAFAQLCARIEKDTNFVHNFFLFSAQTFFALFRFVCVCVYLRVQSTTSVLMLRCSNAHFIAAFFAYHMQSLLQITFKCISITCAVRVCVFWVCVCVRCVAVDSFVFFVQNLFMWFRLLLDDSHKWAH